MEIASLKLSGLKVFEAAESGERVISCTRISFCKMTPTALGSCLHTKSDSLAKSLPHILKYESALYQRFDLE